MNTKDWIGRKIPGYSNTDLKNMDLMHNFSVVWSIFEGSRLDFYGNFKNICQYLKNNEKYINDSSANKFKPMHEYFKDRYYSDENKFNILCGGIVSDSDMEFMLKTLKSEFKPNKYTIMTLLMIVYRLRNNLFHGKKISNGLEDEWENFKNGTDIMIIAMDNFPNPVRSTPMGQNHSTMCPVKSSA